jgi:hypothetical protein
MASPFVNSMMKDHVSMTSKQFGENGAVEFSQHGVIGDGVRTVEGYLTSAFSGILRGTSKQSICEYIKNIVNSPDFTKNELIDMIVMAFHCRECHGDGKGERDAFFYMFFEIASHYPSEMISILDLIPLYGCWKDYQKMIEFAHVQYNFPEIRDKILDIYVEQLHKDVETLDTVAPCSLCAKYFPKEGNALDKKYKITVKIARMYFDNVRSDSASMLKRLRIEVLTPLNRDKIRLIEEMMCNQKWTNIDFARVPSRCMKNNKNAFLNLDKKGKNVRNEGDVMREACKDNLRQYLSKVVRGEAKINGKQLFLHELVAEHIGSGWANYSEIASEESRQINQLQWDTQYKHYKEMAENGSGLERCMVLSDFSGSMSGTPIQVAGALGIMISSVLPEPWRNKFISFNTNPQLLEIPDSTLADKMEYVLNSPWGGGTDFLAAIQLILDVGIKNQLSANDMPNKLIVISDMQFDSAESSLVCRGSHNNDYQVFNRFGSNFSGKPSMSDPTTHHEIRHAFYKAGMQVCGSPWTPPMIVYWNVRDTGGFQVQSNTPNTQMLSGFSLSLLKLVLDNGDLSSVKPPTPYETFLEAVRDNPRYEKIVERLM